MTTAIAETVGIAPEAPVRVGPPSRLEILRHARELALDVGAVKSGSNYFEDAYGAGIDNQFVVNGMVSPDDVCGVCVAGAVTLAQVLLGVREDAVYDSWNWALPSAEKVHGQEQGSLTSAVTNGGTEYVVAVLDQMIADEEAARA